MDKSLKARIEVAIENKEDISASVAQAVNGGHRVHLLCDDMKSLNAFLPYSLSHLWGKSATDLFRHHLKVRVVDCDEKRRSVVVSARDQLKKWVRLQEKEFISKLSVGEILSGKVTGTVPFGTFVNIGKAKGLIHISKVNKPLYEGDKIKVVVISTNPAAGKVGLELVFEKKIKPLKPWHDEPESRTDYKIMSPKRLKKLFLNIENLSSEKQAEILIQLKKRKDWNTRTMLKDGFDWWTVFESFARENAAFPPTGEDFS